MSEKQDYFPEHILEIWKEVSLHDSDTCYDIGFVHGMTLGIAAKLMRKVVENSHVMFPGTPSIQKGMMDGLEEIGITFEEIVHGNPTRKVIN